MSKSRPESMSFSELMEYIINGDPGAGLVLQLIRNHDYCTPAMFVEAVNKLDEKNIRGPKVHDLYLRCGANIGRLLQALREYK